MAQNWTVGQKVGSGFIVTAVVAAAMGVLAIWGLTSLKATMDDTLVECHDEVQARQLEALEEEELSEARAYLLTGNERHLKRMRETETESAALIASLRNDLKTDVEGSQALSATEKTGDDLKAALEPLVAKFTVRTDAESLRQAQRLDQALQEVDPKIEAARRAVEHLVEHEENTIARQKAAFASSMKWAEGALTGMVVLVALVGAVVGIGLSRALQRDIGSAVQNVQSSTAELQASANQQATAAKEQASATNETTTTIKELVATARQIAESAQRVSQIADRTSSAAQSGDQTIQRAQEALSGIKRQVDLIVNHMLDLGNKSQQIGGILEIINELSEQTNILAINATIEAAGAGEVGKRFAVVADEIRKLADRVGGSTKDIRALIDEIRSAVNTTVMATEQGTKAVDAGARQVGEVAVAFTQIVSMVDTTTEAAREIELSTKQQTTAVEQVNVAMLNVAQAAKETESTSGQTLQTASQLATLSKDLTRLIRATA
jgi:CHASE3 domain sensor protein